MAQGYGNSCLNPGGSMWYAYYIFVLKAKDGMRGALQ
jgi:hypothetical protein